MAQERPFDLLESLLWTPEDGYFLLGRHIARLMRSAEYFGMDVGETAVVEMLHLFAQELTEPSKVRLVVNSEQCSVNSVPLTVGAGKLKEPIRVGLATEPIQAENVYLYHKTTQRQVYANALATRSDCDDVILWNERGEVTEASSSNIVLELAGEWYTPPTLSGLLAGTYREELLANDKLQEKVIEKDALSLADSIYLINSVRKWRCVQFVGAGNDSA